MGVPRVRLVRAGGGRASLAPPLPRAVAQESLPSGCRRYLLQEGWRSPLRVLWVGCFLSHGSVEPSNPLLAQAAKFAGGAEGRGVPGTWWLDCCGIRREETRQTWLDSSSYHCTGTWPSSIRVAGRSTCSVWHWRVVHSWALGRGESGSRILGKSLVKVAADEQVPAPPEKEIFWFSVCAGAGWREELPGADLR